jgi:threonyl-tRNA synthetase
MFFTESEKREFAGEAHELPGHVQIFNKGLRSYRDLPLRYGEFGACHRNEPSGALHGLMRVRGFTQDDGHIFCTEDQILPECADFTTLLQKVYRDFGFTEIIYKVATRPEKRVGADELWDKAEHALEESLRPLGVSYEVSPGRAPSMARRSSIRSRMRSAAYGSAGRCRSTSTCRGSSGRSSSTRTTPASIR